MKNNTSFDEKQHVVWRKTTRRLMKNDTSFKKEQVLAYPTRPTRVRATSALPFMQQMWNSSGIPLSARACIQEFYHFCCHKCHRLLPISLCSNTLQLGVRRILTNKWLNHSKSAYHNNEKHIFALPLTYFLHLFSPCVTLVTAKKRNCCSIRASMRALRAGARTSAFPTDLLRFSFPPGFSEWIFRVDFPRGFIA